MTSLEVEGFWLQIGIHMLLIMEQIVQYTKLHGGGVTQSLPCRYHLLFDPPPDQETKDQLKQVGSHEYS